MLASPLYPTPPFPSQLASDDHSQLRPAKDIEAFNNLLPPPIEFIEGSSTGALAVAEDKYEPINGTPKANKRHESPKASSVPYATSQKVSQSASPTPKRQLHTGAVDLSWPSGCTVGSGLHNIGNTCFLNSALQCLLHTPPLLRVLFAHSRSDPCRVKNNGFCMSCNLRQVMLDSHQKSRPFTPYPITSKLQLIAKHMRKGRQEDAHEFLRYAIDALQKSCLAGYPQKIDHKIAETTWVHRIFGGRLRSRVTCRECNHHSDTFDSMLDISLDIYGSSTLKEAFKKFVAVDCLRGADKYMCERCKKPVVAEKRFTIHTAPAVLTVHLKRFSPLGRKIGHFVHYDEHLSLQPVMSEDRYGPRYSLYGIISHAGGGPNSGHYFAHVKGANGRWFEMNDNSVSREFRPPIDMKSAYILFYIMDKGQSLDAAINNARPKASPSSSARPSIAASMKKRKVTEVDEDVGVKVDQPFIGPLLPSPTLNERSPISSPTEPDPQGVTLKRKIVAATKTSDALSSLVMYGDDDSPDNPAEPKPVDSDLSTNSPTATQPPTSSFPSEDAPEASTPSTLADTPPLSAVNPNSFYATPSSFSGSASTPTRESPEPLPNGKKRKSPDGDDQRGPQGSSKKHTSSSPLTPMSKHGNQHSRSPRHSYNPRKPSFGGSGANPYNRVTGSNTLFKKHTIRKRPLL
ncbi:cysteine proteinase [Pisolithus croceorrhizus]|nr:cysteine proteinase [Pisolithus croceorrhizus]